MLEYNAYKETSQPIAPKTHTKEHMLKPKKSFKQEAPKKVFTTQESTLTLPIEELKKKSQESIQEPEIAPQMPKEESVTEEKSLPLQQNEAVIQEIQKVSQEEQSQEFIETNFSIIRDMALKNLVYPKIARKRGWSGTTTIELQIATDGKLIKAVVTHSSGREALDDAALKSVLSLKGKELPRPKTLTKISLPIRFALK